VNPASLDPVLLGHGPHLHLALTASQAFVTVAGPAVKAGVAFGLAIQ
jgi:hypothetical protein